MRCEYHLKHEVYQQWMDFSSHRYPFALPALIIIPNEKPWPIGLIGGPCVSALLRGPWVLPLRSRGETEADLMCQPPLFILESRLYSSSRCHSEPSPHLPRPLPPASRLLSPVIDASREAPQGGAKRSYIPNHVAGAESDPLLLPAQPVLYMTGGN